MALGGSVPSPGQQSYDFSVGVSVPAAGTLYLKIGDATTASTPLVMNTDVVLVGGSVRVDKIDAARAYELHFQQNGTTVETLSLPASTLSAYSVSFSSSLIASDGISVVLVKVSGSGKSTFANVSVSLVVREN